MQRPTRAAAVAANERIHSFYKHERRMQKVFSEGVEDIVQTVAEVKEEGEPVSPMIASIVAELESMAGVHCEAEMPNEQDKSDEEEFTLFSYVPVITQPY